MRFFSHPRAAFALAAAGCVLLLAGAFYMQYGLGQQPCPLCYVQRGIVIVFAVISLLAALHGPRQGVRKLYAVLLSLTAVSGIAAAGRQIWLQHLPEDQLPACLPSMEFMLEAFPLREVISKMLYGSSSCAEVGWTFLGLSIAEMSMLGFITMLLWSLILLFTGCQKKYLFKD